MINANDVIKALGLVPLPQEGGYFRETYRSSLRTGDGDRRSVSTAIYYLLSPDTFSAMHNLAGTEIFHFYLGDCVEMLLLHTNRAVETLHIGNNLAAGMQPQVVVPAGTWQGSRLIKGGRFALMGTTMSPGFDFDDFSLGDRKELCRDFPQMQTLITELTR